MSENRLDPVVLKHGLRGRLAPWTLAFALLLLGGDCMAKSIALEPAEPGKAVKALMPGGKKLAGKPLAVPSLAVGDVGVLASHLRLAEFKVVSVEDESNMVVSFDDVAFMAVAASTPEGARARSKTKHKYINIWLKGFSTKGIVDGDSVTIPYVVTVSETKSYSASHRKKTVLVIEPSSRSKQK